ncbi:serine hydrolase domain-containing protein [Effusibacillus lacus]|uniref:Penicillin-binding protein n=1 Tax=Effusibacillus lacus TaxID=1348429 RepID=A0A292YRC2_9BACL|nr:serine hydrolase domain-containing protein [Effusibacillus lacus]TCS75873.1 CubicO group peptidase (beta-lactamase class C family) [Effusibacillus lacus]GAX91736.1 penicillin-binding protein [Effusibacillus lacus]
MDFRKVEDYLERVIREKLIPGAVLRIEQKGDLLYETSLGFRHTSPKKPMRTDTLFDIASLTKVTATVGVLLTLFERGIIAPEARLGDILPVGEDKQAITLQQCLTHTAGFQATIRLKKDIMEIADVPLAYPPGSKVIYSDLGFLLLGKVIEIATGKQLDKAVSELTGALGMNDTFYNPGDPERCAATEWRDSLGRHQWGEVHDENATVLGGIAGHAGLFSTARDLARYGSLFLPTSAGEWFLRSTQCFTEGLGERRGLGWLLWQPGCFGSPEAGPKSFGHTGFTGTSLWVDPDIELVVVLLTNRVHYGREPHIIKIREIVHSLVYNTFKQI